MERRAFIRASAALAASASLGREASAQEAFPTRPIHFVIPTTSGSVSDAVARVYGESMSRTLKQPIVVDNLPGAETLLALRHAARSRPDGYTLSVSANTIVTLPYVNPDAGYSPRDFVGVSYLSKMPMALVTGADAPYRSIAQLVASAKKEPGSITFGSVGIGTTSHLPVALFARAAGIKLDLVPYKGIPQAIPDVAAGRVALMMGTAPSVGELIKAGRLRALAVTSGSRSDAFPGIPTFAELGYETATYELFLGLMAPAKTPASVIQLLSVAAEEAKKDAAVRKRLEALGQSLPEQNSPEQFKAFLHREEQRMKELVMATDIHSTPR